MERADLDRGFLEALDALRPASGLPRARAEEVWAEIEADPGHTVYVAVEGGRVSGAATVYVAPSVDGGPGVAHLEDVAVRADRQGRGVGTALLRAAMARARAEGARLVLEAGEGAMGFYSRFGPETGAAVRADLG